MNEEELKLLDKIEELPKELNIEIRGLILSEVCLRKENQQLKEQLNKKYENVGTLTSEILYEENTKLVQENQQLKKQYCERTDCSGRIGNSKKVEELDKRLEASERARKEAIEFIKEYEKNQNLLKWNEEDYIDVINEIKKYLDIDKGE